MRALSAAELLSVWECGLGQDFVGRAVTLLSAANPELTAAEIAELPIGRRDASLLKLREWTFGSRISSVATCPDCGGNFEIVFETEAILAGSGMETRAQSGDFRILVDGVELHLHLPNSNDVAAALGCQDADEARRELLRRCVVASDAFVGDTKLEDLPSAVKEAAEDALAHADPLADIRLAVSCTDCGRRWYEVFDVAHFFWAELHAWAVRILREVHVLASAYGWPEEVILGMTPSRRSFYLEMTAT